MLVLTLVLALLCRPAAATGRDGAFTLLDRWARDEGVFLHDKLAWKDYGKGDWGLALTGRVDRGTVLLKVPRGLVLDAAVLREEHRAEALAEALGDFARHAENFWIVLRLYRLRCRPSPHRFSPWLDAMPAAFPGFTPAEAACLPFYARYAARYQDDKFQAFCRAAEALGEEGFRADDSTALWAFRAVNSRFWKTNPLAGAEDRRQTSELVPLGDMMNHRDPPNMQMVPEDPDHVCFAYMGDSADEEGGGRLRRRARRLRRRIRPRAAESYDRDLFLSYGQPGNPHRFLAIFGFVPDARSMPAVWSHLAYPDTNPYGSAAHVDAAVVACADGTVSRQVWDAVLWELWEPSSREEFLRHRDRGHVEHRELIVGVLDSHVDRQLEELAALRPQVEATEGPNMAMIRQYHEFLTSVFTKVKNNLKG